MRRGTGGLVSPLSTEKTKKAPPSLEMRVGQISNIPRFWGIPAFSKMGSLPRIFGAMGAIPHRAGNVGKKDRVQCVPLPEISRTP